MHHDRQCPQLNLGSQQVSPFTHQPELILNTHLEKNINASSHSPLPEPIEKKDRKSVASLITVVKPSSVDHCQDQNLLRTSREVVNEATAPAKIRDSWEDVSTVAAPPLGKDILQKQPINGILSMTPHNAQQLEVTNQTDQLRLVSVFRGGSLADALGGSTPKGNPGPTLGAALNFCALRALAWYIGRSTQIIRVSY